MRIPRKIFWPLYRVTVVFKGGGTMTFDCRGFTINEDEARWQSIDPKRHTSPIRCDPAQVVGVVYSVIEWTLKAPAKEFQ